MRKIKTAAEIARREKRNKWIVGIVFMALMLFSIAGYSLRSEGSDEKIVEERGLKFYYQEGYWISSIGDQSFRFRYLPSEVENVSIWGDYSLEDYYGLPLYFVGESEGTYEILSNLGRYVERYQNACLDNSSCEGDFPVKDCTSNLIVFDGENESIYRRENCVFIGENSVRFADAFLYKLLGI